MKTVAVVVNVAQLAAILIIFFVGGLDLGILVILLLFFLMAVPFINFLALFFAHHPLSDAPPDQNHENGMIKREAMRIQYRKDHCPILKTQLGAFAVKNISEGGICVSASSTTPFKKRINGQIKLLCGDRLKFKATVLRRDEGEVVFGLHTPIGTAILLEEKKVVAIGPIT
jgi:hypothetical protein